MKRFSVPVLVLMLTASAQAAADPPAPACGQSRVLEAVQTRVGRAGQLVTIEPGSVGQIPGEVAGVVYCAVRLHTTVYDTIRLGQTPAVTVEVYRYALELRRNGIFLLP